MEELTFTTDDKTPRGISGTELLQFAETIPKDDLLIMEAIIEEECEQVFDDDVELLDP